MSWYKAIVILAWLSVPVGGSLMLRSSFQDYLAESQVQRRDCQERAALLATYVTQSGQLANQVLQIENVDDRYRWERSWAAMLRQLSVEQRGLRSQEPTHYPSTDEALTKAEGRLQDQLDDVKQAAWKRDAHLKSAGGMFELGQQIANTQLTANYYKRIGAEGIYLRLQEDLALLEEAYDDRLRARNQLNREVVDLLSTADRARRDVLWILNHLDEKLEADNRLTFKSKLKQHAQEFQLRRELKQLVAGSG